MRAQTNRHIIGFHGCDETIADALINGSNNLSPSTNKYDWLGSGIYFWENDYHRAYEYAKELASQPRNKISKPAVVGAIIDLGQCLDLTTRSGLTLVEQMYDQIKDQIVLENIKGKSKGATSDIMLRNLDCYIIGAIHDMHDHTKGLTPFNSVRAGFWEGEELYPNAGFRKKNYIQISIRNERSIMAYFKPIA